MLACSDQAKAQRFRCVCKVAFRNAPFPEAGGPLSMFGEGGVLCACGGCDDPALPLAPGHSVGMKESDFDGVIPPLNAAFFTGERPVATKVSQVRRGSPIAMVIESHAVVEFRKDIAGCLSDTP